MTTILRDSTNPNNIPAGTPIVGGYVDGKYGPAYRSFGLTAGWDAAAWARWEAAGAQLRRIAAVTVNTRSNTADIESQDLTPQDAPVWHRNMTALGEVDLWVYVNKSNRVATEDALWAAGVPLSACSMWIATLNRVVEALTVYRYPIAAQQWIDTGPYDESVVYETYGPHPGPLEDEMLYVGPIHPVAASLRAYAPGSYSSEPFASKVAGGVTVGAVYAVDGYRYSSSSVQATVPPEADYLWWHAKTGGWVPDALLDTSTLAGAPAAAWPASEPVAALYDSATGRYIPLAAASAPDDDSAFVTKQGLKAAIDAL